MKPLHKVDVVISTYNQEKFIKRVLYGVFTCTTTPFNLIMVFDGCTDATEAVALTYIKRFKPKLMQELIVEHADNVFETKANNIGFKLAKTDFIVTLQDDVIIRDRGWERKLTYPLRVFDDVLAVTSRHAHDIKVMNEHEETYFNVAAREVGTLNRNVFAVRDVINRGPVAIRTDYLRKLDFLDEAFAPCNLDEADLSLRAWLRHRWRVGSYWIDYDSPLDWGKTRSKDSAMPVTASNIKNRVQIDQRYGAYLNKGIKHTEDIILSDAQVDYAVKLALFERMLELRHFPFLIPWKQFRRQTQYLAFYPLHVVKVGLKKLVLSWLIAFLESKGEVDVRSRGVGDVIMTRVGLNNGPNREAWLKKTLGALPAGWELLDAGAGELQYKRYCAHLNYTSQDFGQYNGEGNQEGLQMGKWDNSKLDIVSDITAIPVKDKTFDALMCVEVFEHIPDPIRALQEFSRLLKPGGKLILTVPFCSMTHFAPYYFQNGLSKYWYEKFLPEMGFEIEEMEYNGNFFDYMAQELRRVDKVETMYAKTNWSKTLTFRIARLQILRHLQAMSTAGQSSNEFLCFGIHVLASKKSGK